MVQTRKGTDKALHKEWHGKSLGVPALWESSWHPGLCGSEISSILT